MQYVKYTANGQIIGIEHKFDIFDIDEEKMRELVYIPQQENTPIKAEKKNIARDEFVAIYLNYYEPFFIGEIDSNDNLVKVIDAYDPKGLENKSSKDQFTKYIPISFHTFNNNM